MFAGHIGAALVIGRVERRVNVGVFVLAALLLDVLLWVFVLLGWESLAIPADFARSHQPEFVFPYSHGLAAAVGWSLAAAVVALAVWRSPARPRVTAAALIATAVFSHWPLDAFVHAPELPLWGKRSAKVGLGLWHSMPIALGFEALLVAGGLYLFLAGSPLPRSRKVALAALCLLVLGFTVLGMTVAPAPPSAVAMAASSLATIILVCGVAFWLGRAQS